jgi:O-antigen ligase/tetratricopeptide (TPR) repeat protein
MNSKTFRYIVVGCWGVLIAVLPFLVVSHLFFPYITGKNILFRVIVEIMFVMWAGAAIYDKSLRPKWGWVMGIFAGFVAWVGIADLFGTDPLRSFWSNFERMEGYITLLHLFGLFIVSASVISKDIWYKLISLSVIVSGFAWLHGMIEHFGNNISRIDSGFGNPTYMAAYALIHVFFALLLAVKNKQYIYVWGTAGILNLITIYYTGTRGALLGVIGGLVLVAILYAIHEWKNPKIRKVSLALIGAVVAFIIVLGLAKDTNFVKSSVSLSRFSQLATLDVKAFAEDAGRSRFAIWNIAWQGVKIHPIMGWGQDNFIQVFSTYYAPNIFDQEQWFDRTHNVFFDWLIAAGFPGLILYLGIFAGLLVELWRRKGAFTLHERILITGLCTAYFIHTFFVFDSITSYIFIILVWAFVHREAVHAESVKEKANANKKEIGTEYSGGVLTLVGIIALALIYVVNVPAYATATNLIKGLVYTHGDEKNLPNDAMVNQSMAYFEKALSSAQFAKSEIREQLVDTNNRVQRSNATTTTKVIFQNMVSREIEAYATERPFDARAEFFAGIYFGAIGDLDKSLLHHEAAQKLSPKKQTIIFQVAHAYELKGNKAKALELYKEAYELDTSFTEPALRYAQTLLTNNMKAEAVKVMNTIPDEKLMEMRYVNLLVGTNRYDVIAKIFEQAILVNPSDPRLRISLAAAYVELAKRDEAIALLQSISRDIPQAKSQIDYFISEIKAGRNPMQQ